MKRTTLGKIKVSRFETPIVKNVLNRAIIKHNDTFNILRPKPFLLLQDYGTKMRKRAAACAHTKYTVCSKKVDLYFFHALKIAPNLANTYMKR